MPFRAAQRTFRAATLALLAAAAVSALAAQEPGPAPRALAGMDLEHLARIRVTSAGRKPEPLIDATAAITVLTREEIRRSGAATLPEVLRLVPGLEVARVGSRDWAISARGFNEQNSDKMLVLVDGRTTYSPVLSGVHWDALAVPVDEIDRIEVIRGPGGTLWGANAVNGVIRIITRAASESQGARLALGAGSWDRLFGSARYGGSAGAKVAYRLYAGGRYRDPSRQLNGDDAEDDWSFGQAGFRVDGTPSQADAWTVQGDIYTGGGGSRLLLPTQNAPYNVQQNVDLTVNGGNLLAHWRHAFDGASTLFTRAYYDRAYRRQVPLFGSMDEELADIESQLHWSGLRHNDLVVGGDFRIIRDHVSGAPPERYVPDRRTTYLGSVFAQDEISLVPNRFALTLGSKVEHNSYTGWEFEPNARVLWTPDATQSVWAAVSRALRTPARIDADADAVSPNPNPRFEAVLAGSDSFHSEHLLAYELGYRTMPTPSLSLELALFYNKYTDLRTLSLGTPVPATPRIIAPFIISNNAHGHTGGAEVSATWQASPSVRLRGTYSYLDAQLELNPGAPTASLIVAGYNSPQHQATIWSSFGLPRNIELDVIGRYVSRLRGPAIPKYAEADVRLGWHPSEKWEFSLAGQDLLQPYHREFPTDAFDLYPRAIERRGYAKVVWRY